MSRWKTLISVFMLLVWMPATSHCALEAVGILPAVGCCTDSEADCAGDTCRQLESGLFKQANDSFKVAAPDQLACACFLCLQLVTPPSLVAVADFSPADSGYPQDWLTSWTFEHRAALPARAPSVA